MGHVKALDGYRGLAVLLVMWSHFIVVGSCVATDGPLTRLLTSGHYGVDMFFVLSGFLITGLLLDAKGRAGYFKVFIMRRALRIFPLYYFALAVAYGGSWWFCRDASGSFVGSDHQGWFWSYMSNWGMVVKGWGSSEGAWLNAPTWFGLGHFWSLAVEEQFYIFWPWVVAWMGRRKLGWLCLSFLVVAPLSQNLLSAAANNSLSGYVSTCGRLNTLGIGALLAILSRDAARWPRLLAASGPVFAASGLIFLSIILWKWDFSLWKCDLKSMLIPICFGSALVFALRPAANPWQAWLSTPLMAFFGKFSYGLYVYHHLLHPFWQAWFWDAWINPRFGTGATATALYSLATAGASIALALLSWYLLEQPFLSLKRWFQHPENQAPTTNGHNPRP